jgi:AcrR family transcriptional regulator
MPRTPSIASRTRIIRATRRLLADGGVDRLSMRALATKLRIVPSVLYYYFPDKETLLRAVFDETNTALGKKRAQLPPLRDFAALLEQRITFQFDESEAVTAVLKYYLWARRTFPHRREGGYVPAKSALHIEEILRFAAEKKLLRRGLDIEESAKVVTHAINGFVIEYFPHPPAGRERQKLIRSIAELLYPALTGHNFPVRSKHHVQKGGEEI